MGCHIWTRPVGKLALAKIFLSTQIFIQKKQSNSIDIYYVSAYLMLNVSDFTFNAKN